MKILTKQEMLLLGMKDLPRHIFSKETGEIKGFVARSGAGGLLFWSEIIKLKNGEFRHRDRYDLLGNTQEQVRSL